MVEEKNLYYQIVKEFKKFQVEKTCFTALTKTRLIKIAYLVDYFYYKEFRTKLSNIHWIFFLYGPYSKTCNDIFSNRPFSIKRLESGVLDPEIIEFNENYSPSLGISEFEINQMIRNIIYEYGAANLEELIDFIYFETEPMQKVKRRTESLDFTVIPSKDNVISESLSISEVRKLLSKYKGDLSNAIRL